MGTREIGSEFWDVPVCEQDNGYFPNFTQWFVSGRAALEYIIRDCGIHSIAMPRWCCFSMVRPFIDLGVKVVYYDQCIDLDQEAVFLIDYFGFVQREVLPPSYRGVIIRDVTHSLFSVWYDDADYYFGSLRKWAGFWTGGFAWGRWKKHLDIPEFDEEYVSLRQKAMQLKKNFIDGQINDKSFLSIFAEANQKINQIDFCGAHPEDIHRAQFMDIQTMKRQRRSNAKVLLNYVKGIYELKDDDCPLFVPILVSHRDDLRKYLIDHDIFCPVHWPHWDWEGRELSLVCDQRYTEEDMVRIGETIKAFES